MAEHSIPSQQEQPRMLPPERRAWVRVQSAQDAI